jgi:hypothetical protein
MYKMFIDPITLSILKEMKEPTTFRGLLLRSCELLLNDNYPDEMDPRFMRIKGYERFAGAVYVELIRALRVQRAKTKQNTLTLNPYAVWMNVMQDPAKSHISELNPIQELKEIEAVTFTGEGGRSSRSMVQRTRVFHENDLGTISEATVDSGDVGINVFMSADPMLTSVRGVSKQFDLKKPDHTSLLSTSALCAVGSDRDD